MAHKFFAATQAQETAMATESKEFGTVGIEANYTLLGSAVGGPDANRARHAVNPAALT